MKLKILLLLISSLSALGQTNCATVNWTNNQSPFRLRIANYTNGVTLVPCCDEDRVCDDGVGHLWEGTFDLIDTNYPPNIRYFSGSQNIAGKLLTYAAIQWTGTKWNLIVEYSVKLHGVGQSGPNNLWVGELSNTNPIGAYTATAACEWSTAPETLTVECYEPKRRLWVELEMKSSTFQGTLNSLTNQFFSKYCDKIVTTVQRDRFNNLIYSDDFFNTNHSVRLNINDGDLISIQWPHCCNTSWGVAAQGPVWLYENGVTQQLARVTLCFPDFRGGIPINQLTATNALSGGAGTVLVRPFSAVCLPPLEGECHTNAYNGCLWYAHIVDPGDGLNFFVQFEVKELMSCANPVWSHMAGADWDTVLFDLYRSKPLMMTNAPLHWSSIDTNGYTYQWYNQ